MNRASDFVVWMKMSNFAVRKEVRMKIGIIVAMEKELKLLLPLLENKVIETSHRTEFVTGELAGHDVVVCQCGIGKVNSALRAQTLIEEFSPELVINTGVAGGADRSMRVLDLLIADAVAYHDVWCGPGTEYGAAAGLDVYMKPDIRVPVLCKEHIDNPKLKYGLICSGDKFISQSSEVEEIKSHFPEALAVDMESASIAQVCVMNGVPFNILRVISDTPGAEENISQYENFWVDAPAETFEALKEILQLLK